MTKEEAVADFRKRIAQYESIYETISEPDISFCRILNVGQMVTMNKIDSYLQSRIAFYLMNLHLKPRSIYLSRVSAYSVSFGRTALIYTALLLARREHAQRWWYDWW